MKVNAEKSFKILNILSAYIQINVEVHYIFDYTAAYIIKFSAICFQNIIVDNISTLLSIKQDTSGALFYYMEQ